jgi:hypothetical protein
MVGDERLELPTSFKKRNEYSYLADSIFVSPNTKPKQSQGTRTITLPFETGTEFGEPFAARKTNEERY